VNRLTPRWRIVIVALLAVLVGYNLLALFHRIRSEFSCLSGITQPRVCTSESLRTAGEWGVGALFVLLLTLLCLIGAIWALRPLGALAQTVQRLGPQSLAERNQLRGGRRDELRTLARSLNDMLDRISASYENQRRFTANASHELRTPLAVQRALIEVGTSGPPLTADQLELLTRQLLHANERNVELIEGLLVLSESDRGLASTSPQRLDLITEQVLAAHTELAENAGIIFKADLHERTVPGEQVLLERLVTNLVQNAIKYNRPGGRIFISVGPDPALSVANTGRPVPAEAVAALFEPFRRLSADRMSHTEGAGLGLTIARSIAQAHFGTITAKPFHDGGLDVVVHLPAG
jgi:signal transduction histidine kinase